MASREVDVKFGTRVKLKDQGDTVYTVTTVERHNELNFYRLRELPGSLFLLGSLELV